MSHRLHIEIRDSVHSLQYLYVKDLSVYDQMLSYEDRQLLVTVPGYYNPRNVIFPINDEIALTSGMLGLGDLRAADPLPDGYYTLVYSVNPHSQVYTKRYHYRTAALEAQVTAIGVELYTEESPLLDECGNIVLDKNKKVLSEVIGRIVSLKGYVAAGGGKSLADRMYSLCELQLSRITSNLKTTA